VVQDTIQDTSSISITWLEAKGLRMVVDSLQGYFGWIFVTLEPISTSAAFVAGFWAPQSLLNSPEGVSDPRVLAVIYQLANVYMLLALCSTAVLRTAKDELVVRNMLVALLFGDFGHMMATVLALRSSLLRSETWTMTTMGNLPFTV